MRLKKLFINNKLLIRLIISYLISSVLLTMILMGFVSNFVSSRTKNNILETQKDLMRQSYNTAYYALTDIYGDFYLLWSRDEDIRRMLNNVEVSEEEIKISSKLVDEAAFRDDFIDSVYLINKKANIVISNTNSPKTIDEFHDKSSIVLFNDFERNYDSYKNEVFFPRKTSYTLGNKKLEKNYISIIYAAKDGLGKLDSGIIVNIDQNKLSKLMNTGNEFASIIIANSGGKIISDSQEVNFANNLPRGQIYDEIAKSKKEEGSFIGEYLEEKSFITYKKANNIGFVFISITPYSFLIDEVYKINSVIAVFFIIAIIISLCVNIFSTKRIYEPLNDLIKEMKEYPSVGNLGGMDEYEFLGKTYNNLILKDKRAHVSRIFNGNYSETAIDILEFSKAKFLTLEIIPDDDFCRNPDILEEIINIIQENTKFAATITSNDYISCIINENDFLEKEMDIIMEDLVSLQDTISKKIDITVSIGIGTSVNSLDSIKFSHRYAGLAVQYALSVGSNQVIFYSEIENSKVAASVNKDSIADKVEEYVDNNFSRQDFSVEEIAEKVDLSLGYVRQIFRTEKDMTLNDYIMMKRIDKAKELLKTTDDTAKDISEAVGYYDNRYFYTLFKKKVGMTTEEFRKSEREVEGNEN